MPMNQDKQRGVITLTDERLGLPASAFLATGSYVLNADGSIIITGGGGGSFNLAAALGAAQLPDAVTADWNPGDISILPRIRVDTAGANAAVGGLVGGVDGYLRVITVFGGNPLTLLDQSTGAAGNQFFLNGDKIIPGGTSFMVLYDSTVGGWSGVGA